MMTTTDVGNDKRHGPAYIRRSNIAAAAAGDNDDGERTTIATMMMTYLTHLCIKRDITENGVKHLCMQRDITENGVGSIVKNQFSILFQGFTSLSKQSLQNLAHNL